MTGPAAKERVAEISAQLEKFHRTVGEIRITRKTLLELPEPVLRAPPAPKLRPMPRCTPLRSRQVCEAMGMAVTPDNSNNTRLKLKRPAERGILIETEQDLFAQLRL
ncbi:hypothetical protein OHT68_01895 [Streptomyces canus]|uniref:hypothetical protein n=1 Tax=Streptomyces canus TaxID=58343 RepID=UPI002E2A26F2|nr:hypothetical protein [Streptomyces canus]